MVIVEFRRNQEGELIKGEEPTLEIRKFVRGFEFLLRIQKGERQIKAKIDLENKKIEAQITPEGIRRAVEVGVEFLNKPETVKTIDGWTEKLKRYREKLRQQREGKRTEIDREIIRGYAQQEGRAEAEVVEEFLEEIRKETEK